MSEYSEIMQQIKGLAEKSAAPFTQKEQQLIDTLYFEVLGRKRQGCKCKNKYTDAVFEIYNYLKMKVKNRKTELKRGVVLTIEGQYYTNNNITDEIAREYLRRFPNRENLFIVAPALKKENSFAERLKTEEAATNAAQNSVPFSAETPTEEVAAPEEPKPKKRKKSKKQ